jgi:hypothetical protein
MDAPVGIDRARHQDLAGRGHHVWQRRAALVVIAVIPLLGLLNVFGQRAVFRQYPEPRSVDADQLARACAWRPVNPAAI